jgi:hypothetical protein
VLRIRRIDVNVIKHVVVAAQAGEACQFCQRPQKQTCRCWYLAEGGPIVGIMGQAARIAPSAQCLPGSGGEQRGAHQAKNNDNQTLS